ncbi:NAD(FAD)-utilizing dehydrogenases [hydrothermal vent metagenome]|uniref:NAD(FAD)-utilizing dehydrogenases n=1 Tax=hydrothermal vent metagenome TaxID=652676 RepID=A0A1W1C0Z8_9ZZZZ
MNSNKSIKNVIVIGAGASGMMASIIASRNGDRVVLLEKLSSIGTKLKATGGGRCNLTNTLPKDIFMEHFGRDGRFMRDALNAFNNNDLREFFLSIGVETDAPDGFRVFPIGHSAKTILNALQKEMDNLGVEIYCNQSVKNIDIKDDIKIVSTESHIFKAEKIVIATGGLGYPKLGAEGDGFRLAKNMGHKITPLYPAMMPLQTKEDWVSRCRADTIPKVEMRVDIKKYRKLSAKGDLIFTKNGIRGPVVLDFSREITPILDKLGEVPIVMNLTKGLNAEDIRIKFNKTLLDKPDILVIDLVQTLLPSAISLALCDEVNADPNITFKKLSGVVRDSLISTLVWTPLTIIGHNGFDMAMITRGGVSLKDINPKTMESKVVNGIYFCGEVINIDGPCGGYNLQWAFSSGFLVGIK